VDKAKRVRLYETENRYLFSAWAFYNDTDLADTLRFVRPASLPDSKTGLKPVLQKNGGHALLCPPYDEAGVNFQKKAVMKNLF